MIINNTLININIYYVCVLRLNQNNNDVKVYTNEFKQLLPNIMCDTVSYCIERNKELQIISKLKYFRPTIKWRIVYACI